MRVAALVSGGKDSLVAASVARQWGWELTGFLTLLPLDEAPLLFHRPNARWVELQAQAARLPWLSEPVAGIPDEERALERLFARIDADGVVSGALASEYQRTRFERAAHRAGLKTFTPLWHHDAAAHVHDVPSMGVTSRIVHVAAEGLDQSWLGRVLDDEAAHALIDLSSRTRLNPAGEGGEYETFVTDCDLFHAPIHIQSAHPEWHRDSGTWVIDEAALGAAKPR